MGTPSGREARREARRSAALLASQGGSLQEAVMRREARPISSNSHLPLMVLVPSFSLVNPRRVVILEIAKCP